MTLEITSLNLLRETVSRWRTAGESVALVPTMGALHIGHMALVKAARKKAKRVIVSIFVNPTQFGPNEDFNRYPRPLADDLAMLRMEGADAVWLPTVEEMYPHGFTSHIHIAGLSEVLDGIHRPGHFDGVATVVAKLLLQVTPDIALFGEKDYQQLCIIRRMVADLNIPVRIEGVETVRLEDGLALSSRNKYLNAEERAIAPRLHDALRHIAATLKGGHKSGFAHDIEKEKRKLLEAGFSKIDYFALCDADSLQETDEYHGNERLLIAAWLGKTRLIDNIEVG